MLCNLNSPFENFWVGISEKITVHVVKLYILGRFGSIIAVKIVRLETNFDSLPGLRFNVLIAVVMQWVVANYRMPSVALSTRSVFFAGSHRVSSLMDATFISANYCSEVSTLCRDVRRGAYSVWQFCINVKLSIYLFINIYLINNRLLQILQIYHAGSRVRGGHWNGFPRRNIPP